MACLCNFSVGDKLKTETANFLKIRRKWETFLTGFEKFKVETTYDLPLFKNVIHPDLRI